jgi:hypothetical protein
MPRREQRVGLAIQGRTGCNIVENLQSLERVGSLIFDGFSSASKPGRSGKLHRECDLLGGTRRADAFAKLTHTTHAADLYDRPSGERPPALGFCISFASLTHAAEALAC